jgi:hypothetical protein
MQLGDRPSVSFDCASHEAMTRCRLVPGKRCRRRKGCKKQHSPSDGSGINLVAVVGVRQDQTIGCSDG